MVVRGGSREGGVACIIADLFQSSRWYRLFDISRHKYVAYRYDLLSCRPFSRSEEFGWLCCVYLQDVQILIRDAGRVQNIHQETDFQVVRVPSPDFTSVRRTERRASVHKLEIWISSNGYLAGLLADWTMRARGGLCVFSFVFAIRYCICTDLRTSHQGLYRRTVLITLHCIRQS